jgi:hypothetical protein
MVCMVCVYSEQIIDMNPEQKAVLVSYMYWGNEWNEWVTDISGGIAPLKTHTFRVGGPLLRGQRVQVRHVDNDAWVEGFISDIDEFMVSAYMHTAIAPLVLALHM